MNTNNIKLDEKTINELSKKLCSNDITIQVNEYAMKNFKEYSSFYMKNDEYKKNTLFIVCYGKKYGGVDLEAKYGK